MRTWRLGHREVNRYDLYELAVQSPRMEARFLEAVHGGSPEVLGEDFCGPGSVSRAWLQLGEERRAVCVDIDEEPLGHVRALAARLGGSALRRLSLLREDVRRVRAEADVIASLNFGVCELHDRTDLMAYLRNARARLRGGGVLVADLYGGVDAFSIGRVEQHTGTEDGVLVYTWQQREADPLTARVENAMHFLLPGRGPEAERTVRDAFVYHWRLWSVPELREAMLEAGFRATEVYAGYGDAIDGEGRTLVRPVSLGLDGVSDLGDLDENYVVYIAARA